MPSSKHDVATDGAGRIIDSVRESAEPALEAVRKFVETVNGVFPDLGEEGPRRKIIDAAFTMAERLLNASTTFAGKIVKATEEPVGSSTAK